MPVPSARHPQRAPSRGFTLLELLIVVVLGGLVLAAITTVITSQVRLSRTQLLAQQRRSDWSRFTYFLANEVGEGRLVRTDTPAATLTADGCTLPSGGALLFSVSVPIATDTGNPVERNVHFYTTGTGTNTAIFRCGPPIQTSGRLNSATTTFTPARLLAGIPITAAVDANNVSVTLTPSITGANIVPFAVRTRSVRID
jgi:prepilin-type N-terminal cleavage/methylation domain-containing protein